MSRTTGWPGAVLLMTVLAGCNPRTPAASRTANTPSSTADSAFAQVQQRGHVAMGVDQYSSSHRFESLSDGGRITLTRDRADPTGVRRIRAHMADIALAFRRGDFTIPGYVHARAVPGTAIMAERQAWISYRADTVPLGGSLRIHSTDSTALAAIHQFLAFQRRDHRSSHVDSH
jgi:hypothetical protein